MKSILIGAVFIALNAYGSEAQKTPETLKSEPIASLDPVGESGARNVRYHFICPSFQQPSVKTDSSGTKEIAPKETPKEVKIAASTPGVDSAKNAGVKETPPEAPGTSGRPLTQALPKDSSTASAAASASSESPAAKKPSGKPLPVGSTAPLGTAKVSLVLATALDGTLNDFSPVPYHNGIVFVSNSHKLKKGVKIGDADDPEDYNLKFSEFDSTGALGKPANFSRKLNTSKTHEGPVSFTKDGKTMFITRNTAFDDGKKRGKTTSNLKIFIKTMIDGEWSGEETLPFETDRHNYCHPSLSADGTKLYFASDIPGGFGGMDIYMSRRLKDGSWTQPINMGPRVNTDKTELFPYIAENGTLFFASNGRKGAGGLDMFRIEIDSRTARSMNLGEPFNSESDDFGVMFMPGSSRKGYFSSNRPGGTGGDDIYQFEIK